MNKHLLDQFSPLLFMGALVLLGAGAAYYAWEQLNPRTDLTAEDPQAIARYRDWLRDNDVPLLGGKIAQADLPGVYCKVIEHDVRAGDLAAARALIRTTLQKQLADQVLTLLQLPAARELFTQQQQAQRKVAALQEIVAVLPTKTSPQREADLKRLAQAFCALPFDATACPEQAQELSSIYRGSILPWKAKEEGLQPALAEIEARCLPRPVP